MNLIPHFCGYSWISCNFIMQFRNFTVVALTCSFLIFFFLACADHAFVSSKISGLGLLPRRTCYSFCLYLSFTNRAVPSASRPSLPGSLDWWSYLKKVYRKTRFSLPHPQNPPSLKHPKADLQFRYKLKTYNSQNFLKHTFTSFCHSQRKVFLHWNKLACTQLKSLTW